MAVVGVFAAEACLSLWHCADFLQHTQKRKKEAQIICVRYWGRSVWRVRFVLNQLSIRRMVIQYAVTPANKQGQSAGYQ